MPQILLVDDSQGVINEIVAFLESEGFSVCSAINGQLGFDMAMADPELKLMLVDVNMPEVDGLTMVEMLRDAGNEIAVVMLTTENNPNMKKRAKRSGVKGWITKPFNGPNSLPMLRKFMGL